LTGGEGDKRPFRKNPRKMSLRKENRGRGRYNVGGVASSTRQTHNKKKTVQRGKSKPIIKLNGGKVTKVGGGEVTSKGGGGGLHTRKNQEGKMGKPGVQKGAESQSRKNQK